MPVNTRAGISNSSKLTVHLALFLLFASLLLNGVLWLATPPPFKRTTLDETWEMLQGHSGDDSWVVMQMALDSAQTGGGNSIYGELFFKRRVKFQYPPSSLFALMGMRWLAGTEHVRTSKYQEFESITINDVLGWTFVLLMAVSAAILLEVELGRHGLPRGPRAAAAARALLVTGAALTFYPIVKAYTLGQIQVWLNGLFALALLCWAVGKKASSGLLIGLVALIKPHYGLFLLWAALRREWRFAVSCGCAIAAGLAASVATFGWASHVDYLKVLSFVSQHGETYYPNQSVNGLLNRLMSLSDPVSYKNLVFNYEFPPFNPWVYAATLITSVIILSGALLRRRREGDPDRIIDFCIMAASITIASPVAWEHHYGVFLPIFAVLLVNAIGSGWRLVWLAMSYTLIGTFIPATNLLAGAPLNFVQSYVFAGALVALTLLHNRGSWPRLSS